MSFLRHAYPLLDRPLSVTGAMLQSAPASASSGDDRRGVGIDPPPAGAGVLGPAVADVADVPRHTRRRRTAASDAVVPLAGPDAPPPPTARRRRSRSVPRRPDPSVELLAAVVDQARECGLDPQDYLEQLLARDRTASFEDPGPGVRAPGAAAGPESSAGGEPVTAEVVDGEPPPALVVRRSSPPSPSRSVPSFATASPSTVVALVLAALLAVVLGVVSYVAAVQYLPRFEVMTVPRDGGQLGIYRVDRWTGDISYCGVRPAQAGLGPASACVSMDPDVSAGPAAAPAAPAAAAAPAVSAAAP